MTKAEIKIKIVRQEYLFSRDKKNVLDLLAQTKCCRSGNCVPDPVLYVYEDPDLTSEVQIRPDPDSHTLL
jgi:hypothetical protein